MRLVNRQLLATFSELARAEAAWPLYLYGETGRGKTRAALVFLDRVPLSYYTTAEWLVRETLHPSGLAGLMARYNLVVVDEIGLRDKATDLEYTSVKELADLREDKATVWISNLPPERLAAYYDRRLASRILSGTWFDLKGHDRRLSRERIVPQGSVPQEAGHA